MGLGAVPFGTRDISSSRSTRHLRARLLNAAASRLALTDNIRDSSAAISRSCRIPGDRQREMFGGNRRGQGQNPVPKGRNSLARGVSPGFATQGELSPDRDGTILTFATLPFSTDFLYYDVHITFTHVLRSPILAESPEEMET